MDRICPYLAIATDRRSVVDGFDPDHRCHSVAPPEAVGRSEQAALCLTEAHSECVRFLAARDTWARSLPAAPRPAPDAFVSRTRLVLQPSTGRRLVGPAPFAHARRRWAIGGAVILLAFAAVASAASGQLDGMLGLPRASAPPSSAPAAETATPEASPSPTPLPTIAPTATELPTPVQTPTAVPSSAPAPRTYTVVSGDTLSGIAARFGTTVAAIRGANGLSGETINIGQVLVIP